MASPFVTGQLPPYPDEEGAPDGSLTGVTPILRELPVNLTLELDRVEQIKNAIRLHDQGMLRDSALLVDQMTKDDRIKGDLSTLINGILSSPPCIEPQKETRRARGVSSALEMQWSKMYPQDQVGELLKWGIMTGIGVGEHDWQVVDDGALRMPELRPRLRVWHSQFVWYDWSREAYWLTTADKGQILLPRTDREIYSDGHWVIYTPFGFAHGFRHALVRALAQPWLIRQWTYRDWARYDEVHGLPIRKAFMPAGAEEKKKRRFLQAIANLGSEAALECPTNADGAKFDLELAEAKGDSVDAFDKLLERCERSISICLLGQDASGRAQGGSLAQAKMDIRLDFLINYSTSLLQTLECQSVSWWARHNLDGGERLCPIVTPDVLPEEDEREEAEALSALATALSTFALAGSPVDARAILDAHGVPVLGEGEDAAMPAAPGVGIPPTEPTATRTIALSEGAVKRYEFQGFPIAIENPVGSMRLWSGGKTEMLHDYGFIEGHLSGDGEELDVYIGPDPDAQHVHVVHQLMAPDYAKHDEDKIFLGFKSADAARDAYVAHRSDGDKAIGGMSSIPLDRFRAKLKRRGGMGKITASAPEAFVELAREAPRPKYGARRAARYAGAKPADYQAQLARRGRQLASRAIKPDLEAVLADVRAATDYRDLRRRIQERYRGMDAARLTKLMRATMMLANLAGRRDVLKETL